MSRWVIVAVLLWAVPSWADPLGCYHSGDAVPGAFIQFTGTATSVSAGVTDKDDAIGSPYATPTMTDRGNNLWTAADVTAGSTVGLHKIRMVGTVNGQTEVGVDTFEVRTACPMATYTQPTGFLAATFPSGTIANTTNITAGTMTTTTNLTNLPSIPSNWLTAAGIAAGALNGKGDWLTGDSSGVTTLLTRIPGTVEPQTGDSFARLGSNGSGLTGIPWSAAWDAEVESEVTDALNAYDPPTRTEATADKDAILALLPTALEGGRMAAALDATTKQQLGYLGTVTILTHNTSGFGNRVTTANTAITYSGEWVGLSLVCDGVARKIMQSTNDADEDVFDFSVGVTGSLVGKTCSVEHR